jgi:hypothetical protein
LPKGGSTEGLSGAGPTCECGVVEPSPGIEAPIICPALEVAYEKTSVLRAGGEGPKQVNSSGQGTRSSSRQHCLPAVTPSTARTYSTAKSLMNN